MAYGICKRPTNRNEERALAGRQRRIERLHCGLQVIELFFSGIRTVSLEADAFFIFKSPLLTSRPLPFPKVPVVVVGQSQRRRCSHPLLESAWGHHREL